MKTDYIIVGFGLAGLAFARKLEEQNKSYIVFEDDSQTSSGVAGGMYNPVILKRFTPVWEATKQLERAMPFYKKLELQFNEKYNYPLQISRILKSVEEQNNWFSACDKPLLSKYMIPKISFEEIKGIKADFGFGNLQHTGRIDIKKMLDTYRSFLRKNEQLLEEKFEYEKLEISDKKLTYKGIEAQKIVFCEGFGAKNNPFFNTLPLDGAKGELLTIYAPETTITSLVKSSVFILPLGNHYYKIGATFHWTDKSNTPTEDAKNQLIKKLETFFKEPYEIVEQSAGIRPTVKDRRPFVGTHHTHKNIAILNGLGTRGVMLAPNLANELYEHLENGTPLRKEINISRFKNKVYK
ncbi:MAG: FAD-binding oxidoreductase [Flavobacteriaceae bacterium]|nr:FAD-binding oxidoreductase [Flavobacteriaceae bacterium]